jgi:hypothetical protein
LLTWDAGEAKFREIPFRNISDVKRTADGLFVSLDTVFLRGRRSFLQRLTAAAVRPGVRLAGIRKA